MNPREVRDGPLWEIGVVNGDSQAIVDECFRLMNKENCWFGCYDFETDHYCWIHDINDYHILLCNCIPVENLCIGSLSKRKLRVFQRRDEWEEVSSDRIGCIDLDASGRRWEGGVKNGIPFGYGILYDEEGRKEYEGFMVNGCRHYYGSKYYANTNQLKYCGYYCHDKRFGKGTLWTRNGSVDYEGEWWNDKPYIRKSDKTVTDNKRSGTQVIDNNRRNLSLPRCSFNDIRALELVRFMYSLKHIVIGRECLNNVLSFHIDGSQALEDITVGLKSCTRAKNGTELRKTNDNDIVGICAITNCPKLKTIKFDNYAFADYCSFVLENLPSLQYLQVGAKCFWSHTPFGLKSM